MRVLAWAGAPLPLFHPDRGEVRAVRDELVRGTRIEMELDAKERPMHCHHEKLVIVDDRVAYVGGIDLTSFAGNRLDASDHPPRDEHRLARRVRAPRRADRRRRRRALPPALAAARSTRPRRPRRHADGVEAQLVRTVPERVYDGLPTGEFTILESYLRALRAAERFVYLESQFLWSPRARRRPRRRSCATPPRDDFRVVVLLPAQPNNGADDTRGQLGVLVDAAKDGGDGALPRVHALPAGRGGSPVYVHAKIGIVDDRWLTSARRTSTSTRSSTTPR